MVIVGGPTGSGKTTTLYATLSEINRPDINVMTIEDPVEYIFPKVNQIQISEQAGMTFATGLKSILRQDPDVILVGEVRDVETARIAVQSALTGHRVFSSVHAIDAVSSLYRLLDMGIEPFLVTSAIVGVVAQRLVRRICMSCATPYEPSLAEHRRCTRSSAAREKTRWLRGEGCQFCSGTGYFDRVGVYEVLAITDEIRQCVVDGQPPRVARELAAQQGLRTLQTRSDPHGRGRHHHDGRSRQARHRRRGARMSTTLTPPPRRRRRTGAAARRTLDADGTRRRSRGTSASSTSAARSRPRRS